MATVQIESKIHLDIEQLLTGVAQLDTPELEQFLASVSLLLSHRKAESPADLEADLLQKINQGLPADVQQRYNTLRAKLQNETITAAEHQELLTLVDVAEQADAERLGHLIALSQCRQISLDDLLRQLEICQLSVAVQALHYSAINYSDYFLR